MQLKRFHPLASFPSNDSQGAWVSADGRWSFIRRPRRGWMIERRLFTAHPMTPGLLIDNSATATERAALLRQTGLADTYFSTRRAAVAALELALAGASLELST